MLPEGRTGWLRAQAGAPGRRSPPLSVSGKTSDAFGRTQFFSKLHRFKSYIFFNAFVSFKKKQKSWGQQIFFSGPRFHRDPQPVAVVRPVRSVAYLARVLWHNWIWRLFFGTLSLPCANTPRVSTEGVVGAVTYPILSFIFIFPYYTIAKGLFLELAHSKNRGPCARREAAIGGGELCVPYFPNFPPLIAVPAFPSVSQHFPAIYRICISSTVSAFLMTIKPGFHIIYNMKK